MTHPPAAMTHPPPQVLDIHTLMLIAVAGAIALGDYTEAATVVVLFSLADFLEARCAGQVRGVCSLSSA